MSTPIAVRFYDIRRHSKKRRNPYASPLFKQLEVYTINFRPIYRFIVRSGVCMDGGGQNNAVKAALRVHSRTIEQNKATHRRRPFQEPYGVNRMSGAFRYALVLSQSDDRRRCRFKPIRMTSGARSVLSPSLEYDGTRKHSMNSGKAGPRGSL